MAYASIADVRLVSGLSITQISDSDVTSLITFATAQVNEDVEILFEDELIEYIDNEKTNRINGSNTTFYVRYPYLGDSDNDGDIDKDDLYVYSIDGNGTRSDLTVSTVVAKTGKFTLSTAPNGVTLYCTYRSAPVDMTKDTMVKLATAYLTGAFSFTKVSAGATKSFHVGKISVVKEPGFDKMMSAYTNEVNKIKKNWLHVGESADVV